MGCTWAKYRHRASNSDANTATHKLLFCKTKTFVESLLFLYLISSTVATAMEDQQHAVIVGVGIAGLTAALDLADAGATVTIIDMNSQGTGHAILATGMALVGTPVQEAAGINDSPAQAVSDWLAYTKDGDEAWLRHYAEQSREWVFNWLAAHGVQFTHLQADASNGKVPRFHYPDDHGPGIVLPLYRAAILHPNIQLRLSTQVTGILIKDGAVTGVAGTELRSGRNLLWRANHVLLATGGIAGSLERILANWPEHFPATAQVLAGGGVFAQGSGHDMAQEAGAELQHMDRHWFYPIGIPDPLSPDSGHGITLTSPRGIWVNASGQRFINPLASNSLILDSMMQQEPSGFWIIFDETTRNLQRARTVRYRYDIDRYQREVLLNPQIVSRAGDIETLAQASGLPESALATTVKRYNEQVASGVDEDFGRFPASHSDNVTMPVTAPASIQTPPFYAVRIYPSAGQSMGGVRIDRKGRVLARDSAIIPGLYAAGEITGSMGMNGSRYRVNGLYLGPSVFVGRLAAATILESLEPFKSIATATVEPDAKTLTADSTLDSDTLRRLISRGRAGFWHFETSHDVVLSRGLACDSCHAGGLPKRPAASRAELFAQTQTCQVCH